MLNEVETLGLKELRKSLKLTQEEFGNKIGLSRSHVSAIENGTYKPSKPVIKLIELTFNVQAQNVDNDTKEHIASNWLYYNPKQHTSVA